PARRKWLRGLVAVLWLIAAAVELPYHVPRTVAASGHPTLYVIGDSVAAGLGEGEKNTWPRLLARSHPVEVVDLSRAGATPDSVHLAPEGHERMAEAVWAVIRQAYGE